MTASTDTDGHPDIAEISDLTEDLLPTARAEAVRRHLGACERCADVHGSLEEVRGLLGALPAPAGMPTDIAERLDAALTTVTLAEAATDTDTGRDADADADTDAIGARVSRETSPATDRPLGRPTAATGPGAGPGPKAGAGSAPGSGSGRRSGRKSGGRRRRVVLGAVLAAAVGAGSFLVRSVVTDAPSSATHGTGTTAANTFSRSTVQSQVNDLLSGQERAHPSTGSNKPDLGIESQTDDPSAESPETFVQPSSPVPDCVRKGVPETGDVLGAKKGTYDGKGAYLVVLPDADDSSRVTAYVIDSACVSRRSASAGEVLLKESVARP